MYILVSVLLGVCDFCCFLRCSCSILDVPHFNHVYFTRKSLALECRSPRLCCLYHSKMPYCQREKNTCFNLSMDSSHNVLLIYSPSSCSFSIAQKKGYLSELQLNYRVTKLHNGQKAPQIYSI